MIYWMIFIGISLLSWYVSYNFDKKFEYYLHFMLKSGMTDK